jgi:hypothetical protein
MGGFTAQVQQGQTSGGGKFDQLNKPKPQDATNPIQGANGVVTNSATSGQPMMGAPNDYSNTVGQWDNATQQPNQPNQANQLAQLGGLFGKGQNQ